MSTRVIVVGAVAAGMTAASAIRRAVDVEVVVLERGHDTSYSACGVPYWIGGQVDAVEDLVARTPAEHRANGIDLRLGCDVSAVDVDARTLRYADHEGEHELGWDRLVLATGARSIRPDLPGVDARGIHSVKDLDDGHAIHEHLKQGARRAVVVGSGYIGLEMAEACVERGLRTVVLEREATPLPIVDDPIGEVIAGSMREHGVRLETGAEVTAFEVDARGAVAGVRTDAETFDADLVVAAFGVQPRSELVAEAERGVKGGYVTDEQQRLVGVEHVWAVGDCVVTRDRLTGQDIHMPLGTHANTQGLVAGESVAASLGAAWTGRTFPGVVQTAITKFDRLEIARTGLGENAAREAGFDPVVVTVETSTSAGYWPGSSAVTVLGVADRSTRRLLGVQLAGGSGAGLRIDVAAMALWTSMTVDELIMTDLAYAPPFSSVWNPVQVVARGLTKELGY